MSVSLAALAALLGAAALWELSGSAGEGIASALRRALERLGAGRDAASLAARMGTAARLRAAGMERVSPALLLAIKALGAGAGIGVGVAVAPLAPARLAPVVACALAAAGFLAPDAWLQRLARRRRRRLVEALPDALDILATAAASGRGIASSFEEISASGGGPLARELAVCAAEIGAGRSQRSAIEGLRERVGAAEVGTLAAALERSRLHGAPLAEQLRGQAESLRLDSRRRIEERAARAAPKIQLVVALLLVPSVLLIILAALIAHAEGLLPTG